MISKSLFNRFYPNPDQYNGTLKFYGWVRAHIGPETVLLNLGAGPETKDRVRILKGEVAEVIGADIDPIVLSNSPKWTELF